MKKTFPLQIPGRDDARVRDKIRQEVNRYVRRMRRKPVPEGFDLLEFHCRAGSSAAVAVPRALPELGAAIDAVAAAGATEVYLEITAVPAVDLHKAAKERRKAERLARVQER